MNKIGQLALKLFLSTLAVFFTAYILPGVYIDKFTTAILVAVVLSLLNNYLKPALIFFTIPVTFLTLGFFLLVINAVLIMFTGTFIDGFRVDGFWSAAFFSIVVSIVTSVLQALDRMINNLRMNEKNTK